MKPGEHLIVIGTEVAALEARASGLQLRDSLLILLPGPRTLTAYLFRAPIESTVVANVLTHGTGALHIDACRVFTDWNEADRPESWKRSGNTAKPDAAKIAAPPGTGITCHPGGRWPTNLVLVHGPGCRCVGSGGVKARSGPAPRRVKSKGKKQSDGWGTHTIGDTARCYSDDDGIETVATWDCQPDCPVRWLDAMSGVRQAGAFPANSAGKQGFQKGWSGWDAQERKDTGAGGASRFYPQFAGLPAALDWLARLIGA